MIRAESNGTYTASLVRFINASNTLYLMTGNQTYLAAISYSANLLALNAIHWGDQVSGYKLLGVPSSIPPAN